MEATPICRCRVLWLGSAVPHQTKDGLQGIQEPLRELYPTASTKGKSQSGQCQARGIDSWLSVWSNGILLENIDENHKKVTRFFPIDSLHYCAAVRHVGAGGGGSGGGNSAVSRFLPLDSPFARAPSPAHPPLFAAILRRTTGIKVLECHAFICKKEMAANALVRCCFHAYADSSYAKAATNGARRFLEEFVENKEDDRYYRQTLAKVDVFLMLLNLGPGSIRGSTRTETQEEEDEDVYDGDENHKVWAGSQERLDEGAYDLYGTGTGSKAPRPRQVSRPAPVPPPPPPLVIVSNGTGKKLKKNSTSKKMHNQQIPMQMRDGPQLQQMMMHRGRAMSPNLAYAATLPPPRVRAQYATVEPRPLRAARSLAALDGAGSLGSPSRRGHLNERAFSYSIRQEHRARSHASLASLKFAAPPHIENGREELKKEREILQLVAGLGLGGDDLERREVPPGLYRLPR